jgi:hypothetical protein
MALSWSYKLILCYNLVKSVPTIESVKYPGDRKGRYYISVRFVRGNGVATLAVARQ